MSLDAAEILRDMRRAHLRRERDRLAVVLRALEQRAVAAWAGEDITPREGDPGPRAAFYAVAAQLRAWVLELADRGTFARWGVRDRGDLHDLVVPLPLVDLDGHLTGDMTAIAEVIVRGGARARGWVAAAALEV